MGKDTPKVEPKFMWEGREPQPELKVGDIVRFVQPDGSVKAERISLLVTGPRYTPE